MQWVAAHAAAHSRRAARLGAHLVKALRLAAALLMWGPVRRSSGCPASIQVDHITRQLIPQVSHRALAWPGLFRVNARASLQHDPAADDQLLLPRLSRHAASQDGAVSQRAAPPLGNPAQMHRTPA